MSTSNNGSYLLVHATTEQGCEFLEGAVWELYASLQKELEMSTQYHCPDSCNKCGGTNATRVDIHYVFEGPTVCQNCGHKDYWAYGWFESSEDGLNACRKYINDGGKLVILQKESENESNSGSGSVHSDGLCAGKCHSHPGDEVAGK